MITDVMLPGVAGRQVAEELQALMPSLPVLYMSAHPADTLYETGRVPEGASTLQKPFTESELLARVRSLLGEGSDAAGHGTREVEAPEVLEVDSSVTSNSPTLLLVEDSQAARLASEELLAGCGYRVLGANTAREALDLFRSADGSVDAVLTDIGLPDGKVTELVESVRLMRPEVPIVFVSGCSEHDPNVIRLLGYPNTSYVQKPVDIDSLERQVRSLLSER